ncbi:hypothetical protein FEM48_Zijuj08G0179700 [Ziziphus jujuba var. spinosa]|uniref:Pentatricopeptide repeat-containing protein n=1 Tax=Ziziphus jujuba var. spinosa TaxID=714518 RepID=A0A978V0J5_ZIZJJ|nr:hypothetical protein FEM48_Zijuj08G0179700 [Ziziphus jujuba var. spinosa]
MRISNILPDHFTFTATLSACAGACELTSGTKVHALVIVLGYQSSLPINNALVNMYGKCLNPFSARRVFEEINVRNDATWCSLLFAHTKSNQFDVAHEVFSRMPSKVEIAWNIMIAGHARRGEFESCLSLLKQMRESLCLPDQWTLSAIVNACAESLEICYGCMVHAFIVKGGWSSAVEVMNSLLSFYAELGGHADVVKALESIETLSQVKISGFNKSENEMKSTSLHSTLSPSMVDGFLFFTRVLAATEHFFRNLFKYEFFLYNTVIQMLHGINLRVLGQINFISYTDFEWRKKCTSVCDAEQRIKLNYFIGPK